MVDWYCDILGLRTGPRPDFPFQGAWLYAGENAVIHLVGDDGDPAIGFDEKLKFEHFALPLHVQAPHQRPEMGICLPK